MGFLSPASGKSTYIKAAIHQESDSAICISRDQIRKTLIGDNGKYFSKENEVFRNFIFLINKAISDGIQRIYVDATHVSPASRRKVLNCINNRKELNLEVVCLVTDIETAQDRNEQREGFAKVPRAAIANMAQEFSLPTEEELTSFGFKTVSIIVKKEA